MFRCILKPDFCSFTQPILPTRLLSTVPLLDLYLHLQEILSGKDMYRTSESVEDTRPSTLECLCKKHTK